MNFHGRILHVQPEVARDPNPSFGPPDLIRKVSKRVWRPWVTAAHSAHLVQRRMWPGNGGFLFSFLFYFSILVFFFVRSFGIRVTSRMSGLTRPRCTLANGDGVDGNV
jgi:hypothetical protein